MKSIMSRRLIVTYFVLVIILVIFSASFFYYYNVSTLKNNAKSNLTQLCEDTTDQIDMQVRTMDTISIDISTSSEFILALKNANDQIEPEKNGRIIKQTIISNYINKFNIYRISVFTEAGEYYSSGLCDLRKDEIRREIVDSSWYGDINLQNGRKLLLSPHIDNWDKAKKQSVISLIREIKAQGNTIGYIEIQQNVQTLKSVCENEWNGNPLKLIILDGNNELFFSNFTSSDMAGYIEEIIRITKIYSFRTTDEKQHIISVTDSKYNDFKISLLLEKSILYKPLTYVAIGTAIVVSVIILLSAGFIIIMTNIITNPINKLVKKMRNMDLSNLDEPWDYRSGNYESDILNRAFLDMKTRLSDSINKEKMLQKLQTKTIFNVLQSKIGPHFLYNSLGSIANMCENGNNSEAADACYCLSDILRYSANYSKAIVSIKNEVDHIHSYLSLMKSRYLHRLNYIVKAEEDTLSLEIPKLTLQPIVENAIKYSLIEHEKVYIEVQIGRIENDLAICIIDNGCGIEEATLEKIKAKYMAFTSSPQNYDNMPDIEFGGMGLFGTLARLYLHFGNCFAFKIFRNESMGTTVQLLIHK